MYYHHADNVLENDALGITTAFIFGSGVRSDALYAVGLWGTDDVTFTGDVVPDVGSPVLVIMHMIRQMLFFRCMAGVL